MATAMSREFSSERLALTGAARAEAKAQNSSSWTPGGGAYGGHDLARAEDPRSQWSSSSGSGSTSRLSEVTPAARAAATARATTP